MAYTAFQVEHTRFTAQCKLNREIERGANRNLRQTLAHAFLLDALIEYCAEQDGDESTEREEYDLLPAYQPSKGKSRAAEASEPRPAAELFDDDSSDDDQETTDSSSTSLTSEESDSDEDEWYWSDEIRCHSVVYEVDEDHNIFVRRATDGPLFVDGERKGGIDESLLSNELLQIPSKTDDAPLPTTFLDFSARASVLVEVQELDDDV